MEAGHKVHLDARPALAEAVHHGHEPVEAGVAFQCDAQLARRLAVELLQVALGGLHLGQHGACQGQQALTGGQEAQALRGALEQRQAVVRFQSADLVRQGRLAQVHALGGGGQLAGVGDGHEGAQVPEIDHEPFVSRV